MKRYKDNLFPLTHKNSSSKTIFKTISTGINSKNSNVSSFSKNDNYSNSNMINSKKIKKQHIFDNSVLRKFEFKLEPVMKIEEKNKKNKRRNSIKKEIIKCNSSIYNNTKDKIVNKSKKNIFDEHNKQILNKSKQQNKKIIKNNNKKIIKRNNKTKLIKNNSCINLNKNINSKNIKQNKHYPKDNSKTEKKTKNKSQIETKLKQNMNNNNNNMNNNRTNTISPIRDVKILLFDDTKINLSKLQFSNIKQINLPYQLNEENSSCSQSLPIISTERPIQSIHNLVPKINNKYINIEKKKETKISEREFDLNNLKILLTGNTNDDVEFFNNNFYKIPNPDSDEEIIPNIISSSNSFNNKETYLKDFIQNINVQIKFSEKYEFPSNSVIRLLSHFNEQNYTCIQNCFKDYNKMSNDIVQCKFKLIIKNISLCELLLKELLDKNKNENELKQKIKYLISLFYENLNLASDINNIN